VPADYVTIVSNFLTSDRKNRTPPESSPGDLGLPSSTAKVLGGILTDTFHIKVRNAVNTASEFMDCQREIEDLPRALASTPSESSIKDVAEILKGKAKDVALLDQQSESLAKSLADQRQARHSIEIQAKKLRRKIADAMIANEEDARLINLLERTRETMSQFLARSTEKKIGRLAELITESFRFLLRKKALVERVVIDPRTFAIQLEDRSGQRISKQQLSEGEKQIFAISVLWGLSRSATRPLPAVVDTPMGRLDAEHRNSIIDRYFPNASHQVIILSTDTEVDKTAYEKLLPNVDHSYQLVYDDEKKCTTVKEGYFWGTDKSDGDL
jgi:DNA sulfur modification protein DndD